MQLTWNDFLGITPEFFLLLMALVVLMVGLFKRHASAVCYYLTQLALLGALAISAVVHLQPIHSIFQGGMVLDDLAYLLKTAIYAVSFFVFLYSREYIKASRMPYSEYLVLALFSIVGMSVLVTAHHLLVIYLALELFSLPIYALVALHRQRSQCVEAAVKYFVMGAAASGFLLYGMSLYFGATGSLDIGQIAGHFNQLTTSYHLVMVVGLVFMLAGVIFKLGAVPFHNWVPDVYEGAPTSVTLFISAAPKLAALGLFMRVIVSTSALLAVDWQHILLVVAVLSMALGNLVAIVQTNLKRMLAYSSIAHIGYMTLGLLCANQAGYQAALFYMISYVLMSLGAFGFLVLLNRSGYETCDIKDLAGLNSRNPWLAFLMLLIMFSLAGIPPLVGFMAKVAVLEALIAAHYVWLATIALLFAVVGSYYYIKVVKVMYFDSAEQHAVIRLPADGSLALSLNGLATLVIGIFPGVLFHLCHIAIY